MNWPFQAPAEEGWLRSATLGLGPRPNLIQRALPEALGLVCELAASIELSNLLIAFSDPLQSFQQD